MKKILLIVLFVGINFYFKDMNSCLFNKFLKERFEALSQEDKIKEINAMVSNQTYQSK